MKNYWTWVLIIFLIIATPPIMAWLLNTSIDLLVILGFALPFIVFLIVFKTVVGLLKQEN